MLVKMMLQGTCGSSTSARCVVDCTILLRVSGFLGPLVYVPRGFQCHGQIRYKRARGSKQKEIVLPLKKVTNKVQIA